MRCALFSLLPTANNSQFVNSSNISASALTALPPRISLDPFQPFLDAYNNPDAYKRRVEESVGATERRIQAFVDHEGAATDDAPTAWRDAINAAEDGPGMRERAAARAVAVADDVDGGRRLAYTCPATWLCAANNLCVGDISYGPPGGSKGPPPTLFPRPCAMSPIPAAF